jgi:hypothetical protein
VFEVGTEAAQDTVLAVVAVFVAAALVVVVAVAFVDNTADNDLVPIVVVVAVADSIFGTDPVPVAAAGTSLAVKFRVAQRVATVIDQETWNYFEALVESVP